MGQDPRKYWTFPVIVKKKDNNNLYYVLANVHILLLQSSKFTIIYRQLYIVQ